MIAEIFFGAIVVAIVILALIAYVDLVAPDRKTIHQFNVQLTTVATVADVRALWGDELEES